MCRHVGYLGPPVVLADVMLRQPHSLLRQSWAPNDMRSGATINADGFGVAWIDAERPARARRYRRDAPMWSDSSLPDLAESISSGGIVAAVRSATEGMPVVYTACAPFVDGAWMFSHNGVVDGWPRTVAPLAAAMSAPELVTLDAPTDSAFLWALVRRLVREGRAASEALSTVVGQILAVAPASKLNLLLSDGTVMAATTVHHSLWVRKDDDSITISSEPLDPDDRRWQPVPDRSLVEATSAHLSIHQTPQGWS